MCKMLGRCGRTWREPHERGRVGLHAQVAVRTAQTRRTQLPRLRAGPPRVRPPQHQRRRAPRPRSRVLDVQHLHPPRITYFN